MIEEIVSILNSVPKNYCYPRGITIEVGGFLCKGCRFYKNEKCTFNIWKWKGIGNDDDDTNI